VKFVHFVQCHSPKGISQELKVEGAAFALSSLRPFAARLIPDAAPSAAIPLSIVTRTPPAARVTAWRLKFRVNADNPQTAGIGVQGPCKVEVTAGGAVLANGGSTAVADVRVEWEDVFTHNAEQAERRREEAAEHAQREADQAKKWLQEKVRSLFGRLLLCLGSSPRLQGSVSCTCFGPALLSHFGWLLGTAVMRNVM
jgi:hypothetical protein